MEDDAYLQEVRSRVAAGREQIGRIAAAHDMTPLPSATNFVTVDAGGDGAFARRLLAELHERDCFVRMPGLAPLDRCIRISCGTEDELAVFGAVLPAALDAARRAEAAERYA